MSLRPVLRWLPMPHRPDLPRNPLISLAPARFVPAHPAPSRICHPVRSVTAGIREGTTAQVDAKDFSVGSRYFAVRGRLRLGDSAVQEVSLVERNGTVSKVIWRQREALHTATTASLQ